MGPRPPRRGAAAIAGAVHPAGGAIASPRPVAPVGAPSPRRTPPVEAVPLPAETRRALSGIVAQLRNVPRALIGDPAEVVHFLGRTARALERLRDHPVAATEPRSSVLVPASCRLANSTSARPRSPRALSALERAEAVFRPAGALPPPPAAPTSAPSSPLPIVSTLPRIVVDGKGRRVRVEVRRAREAGQLEMPV